MFLSIAVFFDSGQDLHTRLALCILQLCLEPLMCYLVARMLIFNAYKEFALGCHILRLATLAVVSFQIAFYSTIPAEVPFSSTNKIYYLVWFL